MITPNEVRIGNLVMYEGKIYEIDIIAKEMPLLNTIEFGVGVVIWKDLEPIPLTEDILKKCCEANTVGTFRYKDRLIVNRQGEWFDYGSNVKLEYLHQFQNFIFALTNQELNIEL